MALSIACPGCAQSLSLSDGQTGSWCITHFTVLLRLRRRIPV